MNGWYFCGKFKPLPLSCCEHHRSHNNTGHLQENQDFCVMGVFMGFWALIPWFLKCEIFLKCDPVWDPLIIPVSPPWSIYTGNMYYSTWWLCTNIYKYIFYTYILLWMVVYTHIVYHTYYWNVGLLNPHLPLYTYIWDFISYHILYIMLCICTFWYAFWY